ncbi:hypothetical protein H1C71_006036 [Ictidomys tridecemlineatus]|nr:hypothetical protein H1C71_006036 [Ictidomys tridecemlineatus]
MEMQMENYEPKIRKHPQMQGGLPRGHPGVQRACRSLRQPTASPPQAAPSCPSRNSFREPGTGAFPLPLGSLASGEIKGCFACLGGLSADTADGAFDLGYQGLTCTLGPARQLPPTAHLCRKGNPEGHCWEGQCRRRLALEPQSWRPPGFRFSLWAEGTRGPSWGR